MNALDLLIRASLFSAGVLAAALVAGRLLLRQQAALRHALLMGALLLAATAPLWLALAGRAGLLGGGPSDARGILETPLGWVAAPVMSASPAPADPGQGRWLPAALLAIWAAGVAVALGRVALAQRRIAALRDRARPHPELPDVRLSDEVAAAVVLGLRRPTILLAPDLARDAPVLAEVLAHERAHVRRRDPLWGLLERLVRALYWFHPLVHLTSLAIGRAREEACDDEVLDRHRAADYARTLLALALRPQVRAGLLAVQPAAGEVERRIRRLLDDPPPGRRRPTLALAAAALVLGGGAPLAVTLAPAHGEHMTAAASASAGERAPSAAEQAAFALAGPGVTGSFVLRDLGSGHTVVINPQLAHQRVTPASTFKVIIALAGLESGVVDDENYPLPWDGRPGELPAWNQDHTLTSAMRTSANWYFLELVRRIDRQVLQQTLAQLSYGNQDLGADPGQAFMNGDLTISAVEQVEALARLASGAVPMRAQTRRALKQITHIASVGDGQIHGKTGTAVGHDSGAVAWLVGGVQRGPRRYTFALLLRADSDRVDRLRQQRLPIARRLLTGLGALPEVTP